MIRLLVTAASLAGAAVFLATIYLSPTRARRHTPR